MAILTNGQLYDDDPRDYYRGYDHVRTTKCLVAQLERLAYKVTLARGLVGRDASFPQLLVALRKLRAVELLQV